MAININLMFSSQNMSPITLPEPNSMIHSKIFNWDSTITRGVEQNPLAIVTGDVNYDGEIDIVTANNDSDSITILSWNITSGDWIVSNRSVGDGPSSLDIGDVDSDGFVDIVIANMLSNNITILLWNNTLRDWVSTSRTVGTQPKAVCIGDANNDGFNEIVVANYANDNISIFTYNLSIGNWNSEITKNVGNGPVAVEIGDANNDGLNEIVTANELDNHVSILQWNESIPDWNPYSFKNVGTKPTGMAIEDGNNDGFNDIITANFDDNSVTVLKWNTVSEIWEAITHTVGTQPASVAVGDVNSDGQNDIITTNYGDANISILVWNAIAVNWTSTTSSVGSGPTSVVIGDLTNNGLNDIGIANSLSNTVSIVPWNTTSGSLAPSITRNVQPNPAAVALGDANNDGEMDIVTAISSDKLVSILCWNETQNNWNSEITLDVNVSPTSVCIGDANNDGAQDIVLGSSITRENISILLWNKSTSSWDTPIVQYVSWWFAWDVTVADANNDGANDIVIANKFQVVIALLLWNKTLGNWDPLANRTIPGPPSQIEVVDVNNDGFNDLVVAGNYSAGVEQIEIWIALWNNSKGDWDAFSTKPISTSLTKFTPAVAVGDANNDGLNDLVVTDKVKNNVTILCWNDSIKTWNPPIYKFVAADPISVEIGDINNDGQNDIVTSSEGTTSASILLWNAITQDWETQISYPLGVGSRAVIIGDATNDGMNDIITANYQPNTISVLPFNRYPFILSQTALQSNPVWVQNEDFGWFSINLTTFESDAEDKKLNLTWYTSGLNTSLVNVMGEFSTNSVLNFSSIANEYGNTTFTLYLRDSHVFLDGISITIVVNAVNDNPVILSEDEISNNPAWVRNIDAGAFSINLTAYGSDLEDNRTVLKWFVVGLDPQIATVTGENSSDDILVFNPVGVGSDSFYLVLIDSGNETDTILVTINIESNLGLILAITIPIVVAALVAIIYVIYWRRRKTQPSRTRLTQKTEKKAKT